MSRSRRPRKRKGCIGRCYDDGFFVVNRHRLCELCMSRRLKRSNAAWGVWVQRALVLYPHEPLS
jgi:hypothetical protein